MEHPLAASTLGDIKYEEGDFEETFKWYQRVSMSSSKAQEILSDDVIDSVRKHSAEKS